ncbi:competence protein CoiA [Phenylobacterium sp.]|jgi:competence protein CoiA|uniref:competence protein CoiA n=1 Tax=Phenylobacterium sp. TaxID=1871053 RepID=UPI002F3F8E9E
MLTAKSALNPYVEAAVAKRGVDYACRGCGKPVIFKPGRVRISHFAHHPGSECSYGGLMSAEHLKAQHIIAEALRERGVGVELEAPVLSLVGDRRADVLAWPSARPTVRIAVEVQASDITIDLIDARTRSYAAEGIAPLWLRLYDFGKWESPQTLTRCNTVWIEKHHLRSWERWAYDHLGGRLWFMDSRTFRVWRATFIQAHRYNEISTWFGPGGTEESAGGDWREIIRWVEMSLEGPFSVVDLRLSRGRVRGPDGNTRLAAWFLAPGEETAPRDPSVRSTFLKAKPPTYFEPRQVQVRSAEEWIKAVFEPAPDDWRIESQAY